MVGGGRGSWWGGVVQALEKAGMMGHGVCASNITSADPNNFMDATEALPGIREQLSPFSCRDFQPPLILGRMQQWMHQLRWIIVQYF